MRQRGRVIIMSSTLWSAILLLRKYCRKLGYHAWFYWVYFGPQIFGEMVAFIGFYYLLLHQLTIKKLDKAFAQKYTHYSQIGSWRHWKTTQRLTLGVYGLLVSVLLLSQLQSVLAIPDLFRSWGFNAAADYNLDDGLEIVDGNVRLKAQNYAPDGNTRALYHFDETTGIVANDDSGNGNNGAIENGLFVPGSLNNGLQLDGEASGVRVPYSASLGLTQQNTLEGWVNLDTPLSSSSHSQRQPLIDKGDYQVYLDHETGKITYEMRSNVTESWIQQAGNEIQGSWDLNGKRSISAMAKVGSYVYIGTGDQIAGDGEVWRWHVTNETWEKIGGDGLMNSWSANVYEEVNVLTEWNGELYAGLGNSAGDGEVWRFNGTQWTKIGGNGLNSGWLNDKERVLSMTSDAGNLYVGLGVTATTDPHVWSWNGVVWTKIAGNGVNASWNAGPEGVYSLHHTAGSLYAGLGVTTTTDAQLWRFNGATWTQIGGNGINSSWNIGPEAVRSISSDGANIYVGLGSNNSDAQVWQWNGVTWTQIAGGSINGSWNTGFESVSSLYHDGVNLYAGLGNNGTDARLWQFNGVSWSQIGGNGSTGWVTHEEIRSFIVDGGEIYTGLYASNLAGLVYRFQAGSWELIGGNHVNDSWGFYGLEAVEIMTTANGKLYAGTGNNAAGDALVWEFDGTTWDLVGGQGIRNSWAPNTYESVTSMTQFQGNLYVGLGISAGDGVVWRYDGTTWNQVGGMGGWGAGPLNTGVERVLSMTSDKNYLYAGLGVTNNTDSMVWRYDGTTWNQIGGRPPGATVAINSSWPVNIEGVYSLLATNAGVYAGLGNSANDADVWYWDGIAWSQIGGDGINSSWGAGYEVVESLSVYDGQLYAGLGNSAGDAEIWVYDGSSWSMVGGDGISDSWDDGVYERVRSIATYNGNMYVTLGSTTGDGEVWQYDGTMWEKVGGNSVNSSWANQIEDAYSLTVYQGKLFASTGNTTNADAAVWSIGNNGYVQSATSSLSGDWHHIAASYDGTTMRIFLDGTEVATQARALLIGATNKDLLIGSNYGSNKQGEYQGYFEGAIDEVRISNIARTSLNSRPYTDQLQAVSPTTPEFTSGVKQWDLFDSTEQLNGGGITFRLSDNNGQSWKFWNGVAWVVSTSLAQSNSRSVIDAHIVEFPVTFGGFLWQAVIGSNGYQNTQLSSVSLEATSDTIAPGTNASNISALKAQGGSTLSQNSWTNGSSPYFSWDGASDADSDILGYCAYIGTDASANPVTTAGLLGNSPIQTGSNCQFIVTGTSFDTATPGTFSAPLTTSNNSYYLHLRAIDTAGNVVTTNESFAFRFDNTPPVNPGFVSSPSGFVNTKDVTLTWPIVGGSAANDANSGVAGLQYRIGNTNWYGDAHSGTGDSSDLLINDGLYTMLDPIDYDNLIDGINTVYFRTWDQAGNVTTNYTTAVIKLNTSGAPSEPQNLQVSPLVNITNAFSFSWEVPTTFIGEVNNITYCYTFNVLPTSGNCSYTPAGVTSLGSGPYATQPGVNTLYVVARDESSNINYSSYAEVSFTANTPAPGIPINVDIVDVSIKATSNWRLALTWEEPTNVGAGITSYRVYRSTDNVAYSQVGSSSSTTYIDAGLSQVTYFYYVLACDSTNNCGAQSSIVSDDPTGKFIEPAELTSEPRVSNVTTKKARINWSTDRASDSRISIGTTSGQYSPSEIASSGQVTAHEISLDNLSAATTYYFVAKWTDEDGNIGTSQEYTFVTAPAPTVKEVTVVKTSLNSSIIQFTSRDATKITVLYGLTESFGGIVSVNTSLVESSYTVELNGLLDGAKYLFKLVSYDSENNSYDGNIFSFNTPARPRITNLRFQPIEGEPTSTQSVTWQTNVASNTIVTYGKIDTNGIDAQSSELVTNHEIIIKNLEDDSDYFLIAQSRDVDGNLAVSDRQVFRTALDTRPPKISDIIIETSIRGTGAEARGQVIVSWKTDEPSTSQVAYSEGSNATVFNNRTSEDTGLGTEHIVIVSDLPTSRVFSIQPLARDKSNNQAVGESQTAIIGRASDSVLTIILNTLQRVFGF